MPRGKRSRVAGKGIHHRPDTGQHRHAFYMQQRVQHMDRQQQRRKQDRSCSALDSGCQRNRFQMPGSNRIPGQQNDAEQACCGPGAKQQQRGSRRPFSRKKRAEKQCRKQSRTIVEPVAGRQSAQNADRGGNPHCGCLPSCRSRPKQQKHDVDLKDLRGDVVIVEAIKRERKWSAETASSSRARCQSRNGSCRTTSSNQGNTQAPVAQASL